MCTFLSPQRLHHGKQLQVWQAPCFLVFFKWIIEVLFLGHWSSLSYAYCSLLSQISMLVFFPSNFSWTLLIRLANIHTDPHRCQNLSLHTKPSLSTLFCVTATAHFLHPFPTHGLSSSKSKNTTHPPVDLLFPTMTSKHQGYICGFFGQVSVFS